MVVTPGFESIGPYDRHGRTHVLTFPGGLESASISKDKYGFINRKGEWVIQPRYTFVEPFRNGWARVRIGKFWGFDFFTGKVGYVDTQGKPVIPLKFDHLGNPAEGMVPAKLGGKWGYLDAQGKTIIKPRFDWAGAFSEGLARIFQENQYGFVDKSGRIAIEPQFEIVGSFHEGLALASGKQSLNKRKIHHSSYKDGKLNGEGVGYTDRKGAFVIAPGFKAACDFEKGQAWVQLKNGRWCAIDRSGKYVTKPYHYPYSFTADLSPIRVAQKVGYVDPNGAMVIKPLVAYGSGFLEGLAMVKVKWGGKYGYINQKGEMQIPPRFDDAKLFYEGVAWVNIGCRKPGEDKHSAPGKWGLINKKGDYIIRPSLEYARSFNQGLAYVRFRSTPNEVHPDEGTVESGYVNLKGEAVYRTTKRRRVIKSAKAEVQEDEF